MVRRSSIWLSRVPFCRARTCSIRLISVSYTHLAAGETIHVALEAYAGHKVLGTMPFEDFGHCDNFYPNRWDRHFKGMTVVEIDPLVEHLDVYKRQVQR